MRGSIRWVLLSLIVVTGWSFGQPAAEKPSADKAGGGKQSLDDLLAAALRHSPDVQVADAKVRAAQAELRRVRLTLLQKVIEANAAVDANRTAVMHAEEMFRRIAMLVKTGNISAEEHQRAEAQLAAAKATLAQAETTLNALTGNLPGAAGTLARDGVSGVTFGGAAPALSGSISGMPPGGISGINSAIGGISGNLGGISGAGISGIGGGLGGLQGSIGGNLGGFGGGFGGGPPPVRVPSVPMADKLRKALDATVKVGGIKDKPLAEFVTSFRPAASGVPFLLQLGDKANVPVSLSLDGDVQLGAVFQALEDVVPGLKCYVREYGILVTMDDNPIQDAMPLIEFWQRRPGPR
jgi:hypothetical protein